VVVPAEWLVTARPIYTVADIGIVVDPTGVQVVPFD
jgi:hypothetical protein